MSKSYVYVYHRARNPDDGFHLVGKVQVGVSKALKLDLQTCYLRTLGRHWNSDHVLRFRRHVRPTQLGDILVREKEDGWRAWRIDRDGFTEVNVVDKPLPKQAPLPDITF